MVFIKSDSSVLLCIDLLVSQGQAQECLLEKTLLDNRKSFLIARISAQVGEYDEVCVCLFFCICVILTRLLPAGV